MSLRLLPNVLTIFRMIVVGPIMYTLLTDQFRLAFFLAMTAAASSRYRSCPARKMRSKTGCASAGRLHRVFIWAAPLGSSGLDRGSQPFRVTCLNQETGLSVCDNV